MSQESRGAFGSAGSSGCGEAGLLPRAESVVCCTDGAACKGARALPRRFFAFLGGHARSSGVKTSHPASLARGGVLELATSYFRKACRLTIIGATAFHFRVRNGNGWGHCAMVTRQRATPLPECHGGLETGCLNSRDG